MVKITMNYTEWIPWYDDICNHFGYSQAEDYLSSLLLDRIAHKKASEVSFLNEFTGSNIQVVGNGPNLSEVLEDAEPGIYFVADSALSHYYRLLGPPDAIVTDLDGDPDLIMKCQDEGSRLVVHAHGDNQEKLGRIVPGLKEEILCTTQNVPFGKIYNFAGFTDGDRAAFLADYLGAQSITLLGFNFRLPTTKAGTDLAVKAEKLKFAERLLVYLAASRGKKFTAGNVIEI